MQEPFNEKMKLEWFSMETILFGFFIFLSTKGFAQELKLYTIFGGDIELGLSVENIEGPRIYSNKRNYSLGLGASYQVSNFRFGLRYEQLTSTYTFTDRNNSRYFSLDSENSYYSMTFDYIAYESSDSLFYFGMRFGAGDFKLRSNETGNSNDQKVTSLSLGLGGEIMISQNIYLYAELFVRAMFIKSMTIDDQTHSSHEINKPIMPTGLIGVGYSF